MPPSLPLQSTDNGGCSETVQVASLVQQLVGRHRLAALQLALGCAAFLDSWPLVIPSGST